MNKIFTIGLVSMVGFVLTSVIASALPTLTITGFTANGNPMSGDLTNGFVLRTDNLASTEYKIQFLTGSQATPNLAAGYYPLTLVSSTVSAADLKAYYDASGIPDPFLTYLKGAVDGTEPFAYVKGDGTTSIVLIDGARHNFDPSNEVGMAVPGNYPLGTYTVSGNVQDSNGDSSSVTLKLIVAGTCDISANPTTIPFSNLNPTDISTDQSITLTNTGTVATNSLTISGMDWSDGSGHTIPVGQTHWSLSTINSYGTGDNVLTFSDVSLGTTLAVGTPQDVHFMLKIPGGQFPASYSQQITFTSGC